MNLVSESIQLDEAHEVVKLESYPGPVSIDEFGGARDGGTIWVTLVFGSGERYPIYFDGSFVSPTRGRLYIGRVWIMGRSEQRPPKHLVSLGGDLQEAVLRRLQEYLDGAFTEEEQIRLATLEWAGPISWESEKEYQGYVLLHWISDLLQLAHDVDRAS